MRSAAALLVLSCLALTGCQSTRSTEIGAAAPVLDVAREPTMPELRLELLELRERDQEARAALMAGMREVTAKADEQGRIRIPDEQMPMLRAVSDIDAESTAFLRQMIIEHGWPTYDMVGKDGADAAWILAQHADADPALQTIILELMEPLVEEGQATPHLFAMLTDRVLTGKGEPQLYGTQFSEDENGVNRPLPVADVDGLNERRASVGLGTIEAYAERIAESYGGEASPEPLPSPGDGG